MCVKGYETYECGHARVAYMDCPANFERVENGGEWGCHHNCPAYQNIRKRFGEDGEAGPRCIMCEKKHVREQKKIRREEEKAAKEERNVLRRSKADKASGCVIT